MSGRFDARSPQDLADLIAGHPLAWLCAHGPVGLQAAALPLLPLWHADGRLAALEGHLPRRHALVPVLQAEPHALVLWMGVQGYVSPSWLADRTQAPSWAFASAQCRVAVRFDGRDAAVAAHLHRLADAHEAGRPGAWSASEMGPRFAALAQHVIAFRAEPLWRDERYKLGQDERDDVYAAQLAQLEGTPLAAWMRRFNPGRGPVATDIDPTAADAPPRPS